MKRASASTESPVNSKCKIKHPCDFYNNEWFGLLKFLRTEQVIEMLDFQNFLLAEAHGMSMGLESGQHVEVHFKI